MDTNDKKLREVLMTTIKERLGEANIVSVEIKEDTSYTDDTVLRVYVVYEVQGDKLDSNKVAGLLRWLRPALDSVGEARFPVMSFISKRDAESDYTGAA